MSVPIIPISSPAAVGSIAPAIKSGAAASASDAFGTVLSDAIGKVEGLRENSQRSIDKLLSGERGELHDVALAAQKAQLGFEMFVQVRNKVVQAYQEVMRMQL